MVLPGSNRDACHAELLGELAGAVAGERTGEKVAHLGWLCFEQHGQRGRVERLTGPLSM
jgi:hypothetical protein